MNETNSILTSLLARCLLEPEFHRKLSEEPEAGLREAGFSSDLSSSFALFDFTKLQLFGGLITQTRHNFLWEALPYSRALMKFYQMEVSMFSSYRERIGNGQTAALSRSEKISRFVEYLKEFLQTRAKQYPGLLETLIHESICWKLEEMPTERLRSRSIDLAIQAAEFDRVIVDFPGNVLFAEYRHDPLRICLAMDERDFAPLALKQKRRRLVYRMNPATGELSISEVTPIVYQIFQRIDGNRTVGSILRALAGSHSKRELRGYFRFALERGLIRLRSSQ